MKLALTVSRLCPAYSLSLTNDEMQSFVKDYPSPFKKWRIWQRDNKLIISPSGQGTALFKTSGDAWRLMQSAKDSNLNRDVDKFTACDIPEVALTKHANRIEIDLNYFKIANDDGEIEQVRQLVDGDINGVPLEKVTVEHFYRQVRFLNRYAKSRNITWEVNENGDLTAQCR